MQNKIIGTVVLSLLAGTVAARASIISIVTGDVLVGNRGANLITNGSFETGNAGVNTGWTPGTHLGGYPATEVASIPGWTSSFPAGAYGWWGPLGFGGAPPVDGLNAVYFGNSITTVSLVPVIAPNGVMTFSGAPAFSRGPVTLGQTLTGLSTASNYLLDFWVSGLSLIHI